MRKVQSAIAMLAVALLLGGAGPAAAQFYTQHNLVSDGAVPLVDPPLVNPWGLVASATSPWWVSNNGTGSSTLYNGNTGAKVVLGIFDPVCGCVHVPGAPTGVVFNGTPFTTGLGFVVTDPANPATHAPARFIFAAEDGSISGWFTGDHAFVAIPPSNAVYKGLAIVSTIPGNVAGDFLYATNFRARTVDVFNSAFVKQPAGQFVDPTIPADYAPFGIQTIGDVVYVTYALPAEEGGEDEEALDDVPGMGHGFVSAFDLAGNFIRRVASRGTLNSPWGLARAPSDFGKFSNDLLVGNFGNGRINAYDPDDLLGNGEYKYRGMMHSAGGPPLEIEGLWALQFGNGGSAGPTTTLFFTAGPDEESHGLFGSLVPANPPGKN